MRFICCVCLFFTSCANRSCFENSLLYQRFKEIDKSRLMDLTYDGDKSAWWNESEELKRLFNSIYNKIEYSDQLILLEIGSMFNNQRKGIVYFFGTDDTVSFSRDNKFKYSFGDQEKYPALLKMVSVLKINTDGVARHIQSYFQTSINNVPVYDAGFCRVVYLSKEDIGKPGGYYCFTYLPDRILSDEFDKEFNLK